jgi:hypothetical protein
VTGWTSAWRESGVDIPDQWQDWHDALDEFGGKESVTAIEAVLRETRRALFMCASHCQGAHSDAGVAAASILGVPFPITMPNLKAKAISEGFNPDDLWPWLIRQEQKEKP